MIFYFSATGNSKYVATKIATELKEDIISITECIRNTEFAFSIKENEKCGFVTPTYFWGLPIIVNDFLEKLELQIPESCSPYIFHIVTYGTTTGQASYMLNNYLKKKGLSLSGRFSVQMPDTWTPVFNLSNREKVGKINQSAEKRINETSEQVKQGFIGDFSKKRVPLLAANICYGLYEKKRKTKNFKVEESCIGCGLCAKQCPIAAINMQAKIPMWINEKCTLCLGCLHHCPKFAIQYGRNTKKHGQYVNPNVKI